VLVPAESSRSVALAWEPAWELERAPV
jgi:hypothetical protein